MRLRGKFLLAVQFLDESSLGANFSLFVESLFYDSIHNLQDIRKNILCFADVTRLVRFTDTRFNL